jgi:uracil-DNA glycosylase
MTTINDDREKILAELAQKAEACRACPLGNNRNKNVFSDGNPFAKLMIVGEGPGEQEDKTGLPFVGPAGELLNKMLAAIGLDRHKDTYIANVVKCRAWESVGNRIKNRVPRTEEAEACEHFLLSQIQLVKPKVILATGGPAAKLLLRDSNFKITKGRGHWYSGPDNVPVMVTFHPAYLLRLTGDALNRDKKLVWGDLKEVRKRLDANETSYVSLPTIITPKTPAVQQLSLL